MTRPLRLCSRSALVAATIVPCAALPPGVAYAAFSGAAQAAGVGYGSATLQPPASVSVTCSGAGPSTSTATVTFVASPSSYTTGYTISWSGTTAGSTTAVSTPKSVTGLTKGGSYTFTIRATYRSWTSTSRSTATVAC